MNDITAFTINENKITFDISYIYDNSDNADKIVDTFTRVNDYILTSYETFDYIIDINRVSIYDVVYIPLVITIIKALQNKYTKDMRYLYILGFNKQLFDIISYVIHPNIVRKIIIK
jgi:hypothetical protein